MYRNYQSIILNKVIVTANCQGTEFYVNGKLKNICFGEKELFIFINGKKIPIKKIMGLIFWEQKPTRKNVIIRIDNDNNNNNIDNLLCITKSENVKKSRIAANKGIIKIIIIKNRENGSIRSSTMKELSQMLKISRSTLSIKLKNGYWKYKNYDIYKKDLDFSPNSEMKFTSVPGQTFSICLNDPSSILKKNGKLARLEKRSKYLYYKNKNVIYYYLCAVLGEILPENGICSAKDGNHKNISKDNVSYRPKNLNNLCLKMKK